jgi:hypothetical protein
MPPAEGVDHNRREVVHRAGSDELDIERWIGEGGAVVGSRLREGFRQMDDEHGHVACLQYAMADAPEQERAQLSPPA